MQMIVGTDNGKEKGAPRETGAPRSCALRL